MPKHDDTQERLVDELLNDQEAIHVEAIAKIMAEHLYAQPNMTSEQAEQDDCSEWAHTSEDNKRIFRSCALDVYNYVKSS